MTIGGILLLVLTYTLIGFGFACGWALFRWASRRIRTARRMRKMNKVAGETRLDAGSRDRIMRRL